MNALIKIRKIAKIIKKVIITLIIAFCTVIIALLVFICIGEICYGPHPYCRKKVELTYLGTATGECPYFKDENGQLDPEQWKERKFVYCYCQSYICIHSEGRMKAVNEECNLNYNFDFTFREGHRYVCAYGYPLKTLRYSETSITHDGRYYNCARLDKRKYKEGEWFIYEIEDINLGDMFEERELVGYIYMY